MDACMPPSFHVRSAAADAAIIFDNYSDCSSEVDSQEVHLKQEKNIIHDDVSTTSGDETHPWQSADEHTTVCMSASSGDEQLWIKTQSKREPVSQAADCKPGRQQAKVYPMAFLLQMRTLLAVCQPPPNSLKTKPVSEIAMPETTLKQEPKSFSKHRQHVASKTDKSAGEDRLLKAVTASLATLSVDNVRKVAESLKDSGVSSLQHLSFVLQEVHNWATTHNAQAAGAALCAELKTIGKISAVAGADGEPNSFRQLILDSCWPRFQEFLAHGNELTSTERRKGIATVKYISELILKGLVSPRMLITAAELLLETFKAENRFIEALEALIALLMASGPHIDANPAWVHKPRMNVVFDGLGEVAHKRMVPPSLCLLIGEVIALRQSGWCVGKSRNQHRQVLTCVARSVEREPPKPKQHQRQSPAAQNSKSTMLSLAREMLMAPVPSNQRRGKEGPRHTTAEKRHVTIPAAAVAAPTKAIVVKNPFNAVAFHKVLSIVLRGLNSDSDVAAAVQKIQEQKVPHNQQAKEYADLLTRACEISRNAVRASAFGLAAGLVAEPGVFDHAESLKGLRVFFEEVYPDLREEVTNLGGIIRTEMLPSLRAVFAPSDLEVVLPPDL